MSADRDKRAPIVIREARAEDAAQLVAWAIAMAMETEAKKLDPETIKRGVRAVLDDASRGHYFIADRVHNGVAMAVGTLMVTHEWSDWRCGDWWWIQSVYIAPEYRRRGVYSALHKHVRTLAEADAQVCGLRLYVERDNLDAQRTYKAMGMHDAGYRVYEGEFPKARG